MLTWRMLKGRCGRAAGGSVLIISEMVSRLDLQFHRAAVLSVSRLIMSSILLSKVDT